MKKKIRVLFLGTNRRYFNDTIQLFPLAVASSFEMVFYGPGYQTKNVLDLGVKHFVENNEIFDLLFTDGIVFFFKDTRPFLGSYNYFSPQENLNYIEEMKTYFINSTHKKLLYPSIDFYNVSEDNIKMLEKSNTFLLAWGIEFHEYVKESATINYEPYGKFMNDNWTEFIKKNPQKIISVPQIINNNEFFYLPLKNRAFDVSVPGAGYYYRKLAYKILKATKFKINGNNTGLYQSVKYFFLVKFHSRASFSLLNRFFVNTLEDSKMVFTCGGAPNYVVRKYLEISAIGAAMICYPCKGIAELGYIHDHNAIIIDDVNQIDKVVERYLSNPEKLQMIASNGQKLVWDKHSFHARTSQIQSAIVKIIDGTFTGSYWEDGEFYLR